MELPEADATRTVERRSSERSLDLVTALDLPLSHGKAGTRKMNPDEDKATAAGRRDSALETKYFD
jgi:hypothetical protein